MSASWWNTRQITASRQIVYRRGSQPKGIGGVIGKLLSVIQNILKNEFIHCMQFDVPELEIIYS